MQGRGKGNAETGISILKTPFPHMTETKLIFAYTSREFSPLLGAQSWPYAKNTIPAPDRKKIDLQGQPEKETVKWFQKFRKQHLVFY
jgi:hypothetical protein